MAEVRVGCSGFMYNHWRGVFYPEDIPKGKWFDYYTTRFDTVELNVTFYRLPKPSSFKRWYSNSPEGFCFSLKGSRLITHLKRLKGVEEPLENLLSLSSLLREKLSVMLWQFPPGMERDLQALEEFLKLLKKWKIRSAFEFRNPSWIDREVTELLKHHGQSYCQADWPEFNLDLPVTADFIYIRRHGQGGRYNSCYTDEQLKADAKRIRGYLKKGLDVYIYFNNDAHGYAPKNATTLKELI
ncbi:MAG: DUF72 domain-containing protein [Nitrospirae bacterium]|nr:MAG: DUF72 domain-containing protein [Nitrospirota bacterium]